MPLWCQKQARVRGPIVFQKRRRGKLSQPLGPNPSTRPELGLLRNQPKPAQNKQQRMALLHLEQPALRGAPNDAWRSKPLRVYSGTLNSGLTEFATRVPWAQLQAPCKHFGTFTWVVNKPSASSHLYKAGNQVWLPLFRWLPTIVPCLEALGSSPRSFHGTCAPGFHAREGPAFDSGARQSGSYPRRLWKF